MRKITLKTNIEKRKLRVRKKIFGTAERPRISIFRSNKYIYAQLIDDKAGKTVASVGINDVKKLHKGTPKVDAAFEVGKLLAAEALSKKISSAVFDRSSYKFHGRVKSIADGAREGGLEF